MNLVDAPSERTKLEGIQRMLRSGAPRRALRRELSALLPAPAMLGRCRLRYARFGPDCTLTAHYDAFVSIRGTDRYGARPVAVTWGRDGDTRRHHGTADLVEIQAEAVRHGVLAPFRQLTADAPEWSMRLQISPLDGSFPQLVRWADPRYARDVVADVCAAGEVALTQLPASQYAVTLVRYRPGKRHVLRYDSVDAPEGGTIFAKLYPGEKGERVHRVATRVAEWLADRREGVTSVRPLAYVAEDAVVLYPRVLGTPLSDRLRRPGQGVARCLERAGAALHALHGLPEAVAGPLQCYDFAAEIRQVERDSAHVPVLLPAVGAAIGTLLDRARELQERLPQEPPTFTHRDFKCEHLLVAPGRLTLIDFDRCALADPAYDTGKFLADLQWWFTAYDQDGLDQAQEQFIAGYAPGAPPERLLRARLYEAVQLVQMAVLRSRLFEHEGACRTERLIGHAQAVMSNLQRALGWTRSLVTRKRPAAIPDDDKRSTLKLADGLSMPAKLEVIQWLLRSPASRTALRAQLKALLPAPNMLGPCRLRRARFKPGRRLTAYYDALVRVEGTEGFCARPLAVTWTLDGNGDQHHGKADLAALQAEAVRHGVASPFQQLMADRPEWSMHLQVSPLDARFPQLVRLSDPRHVHDMLAGAHAARDAGRDQVRPGRYAVTSIRYHPGQRHVLRYDSLDVATGGTVLAKLYTGEQGARAFRVASHAADWLAEHVEGVTAVRPLAYVAEDAVVLYPRVVGAPLSERLHRPGQDVARCLERAGAALHALHRLPLAVTGPLKLHDFAAEVSEIAREACDHIPALLPSVGPTIDALLARAGELHERLSQEPPTFTHGDFKSEHVWATPGGSTLIDFDGYRLADPAYDVGKFLADLQLWFTAYDQEGLEQAQEQFLAGYAPSAPEERLLRARLYEAVQLVKIARRVPLFDRDWASLVEHVIRRAQAVMNDLERTLGLPATPPSLHGLLDGSQKRHHARRERRRQPSGKGAWG